MQNIVLSRSQLGSYVKLVNRLTEAQKEAVKEIGFGGILNLRQTKLEIKLLRWLADKFNPKTQTLNLHGKNLKLTLESVSSILGLKNEGLEVSLEKPNLEISARYVIKGGRVSLKILKEELEKCEEHGEFFKRNFALYTLGAVLCPTTNLSINQSFLSVVEDVANIGNRN